MDFANADEIISYLGHSTLPTLIVEGRDDMSFLRPLERQITGLDIIVAQGKHAALKVAKAAVQFTCPVAILVDSDYWVINGVPVSVANNVRVICTDGYSIENDLLRDGNVLALLTNAEHARFNKILPDITVWFSACIASRQFSSVPVWRDRLGQIYDFEAGCLKPKALGLASLFPTDPQLKAILLNDFERLFRGKTLKSLYGRFLSAGGRQPSLDISSILATAWVGNGPHNSRIKAQITAVLNL